MPTSADEGKSWLITRIASAHPQSILDIGAGSGTYARLLRSRLPHCHMTAVEIFEPYVAQFDLHKLYDDVVVGDARTTPLVGADVVIMGDVIEHMSYDDAVSMWNRARRLAQKAVFVSLPVVPYPQGAMFGNKHEAHLHTWSHDDVLRLPGVVDFSAGRQIGVYEVEPSHE